MDFISLEQTGNAKNQNRINTSVLFNYVLRNGPTYKSQVAQELSISLPAVSRVFDALESAGFIEKSGVHKSSCGRPVEYYRASVRDGFVVGIDLLKQKLAIKPLAAGKEVVCSKISLRGKSVVADLQRQILSAAEVASRKGCIKDLAGLKAICIGSPGIVDYESGEIRTAVFHNELCGVNFKAAFEGVWDVPVIVDNVVNLSAFAEFRIFHKFPIGDLVCLDIGFEVGAGLVIEGRVYRGRHSMAGEIGFIRNSFGEGEGASEQYARSVSFIWLCEKASASLGIESRYDDYLRRDENMKTVIRLFALAAEAGHSEARAIVDAYLHRLAVIANSMQMVLDPDVVMLSGDICQIPAFKDAFLPRLNSYLEDIARFHPQPVVLSEYGTNSALIGACDHAFDTYIRKEFPYVMG